MSTKYIPLSLYIHIPWCIRKCPYCDFNSHPKQGPLPEENYVEALLADLKESQALLNGRPIHSLFFGGGTPSLFQPDSIATLIEGVSETVGIKPNAEITLEANPSTFEQARFQGYRQAGVNRLSVGVQSFSDEKLKVLGRIHSADEARATLKSLPEVGFDFFNIDLMYGLPQQTPEEAQFDLQQALSFNPTHLSWYNLTIEPNTEYYRKPPRLPDESKISAIEAMGYEALSKAGFERYEISAYAKQSSERSHQSQHNLNYWQFGDYLGIGAGAHSKLTLEDSKFLRFWKVKSPYKYLQSDLDFTANQKLLTSQDCVFEFMMNGMRLMEGVTLNQFKDRTRLQPEALQPGLQRALKKGLVEQQGDRLYASKQGVRFLNDLISCWL